MPSPLEVVPSPVSQAERVTSLVLKVEECADRQIFV